MAPAKTGLAFIDTPRKVYSGLVDSIGPVGAAIVTGAVFLILLGVFIGVVLLKSMPNR